MTDKETLILAAKAAGVLAHFRHEPEYKTTPFYWNSLESNDDCFRMETALGLDLVWWKDRVVSWFDDCKYVQEFFADHNGDKDKARRYASTRAAALRGRE